MVRGGGNDDYVDTAVCQRWTDICDRMSPTLKEEYESCASIDEANRWFAAYLQSANLQLRTVVPTAATTVI